MKLLQSTILLAALCACSAQNILQQTCSAENNNMATVQNGATALIGGLICTDPDEDIQAYEAIRWAFDLLNKEKQMLNGEYLNNSYVPGIKLGMKVINVCSESESALTAIAELFPQISSKSSSCSKTSNLMLGTIGTSSSGSSMEVSQYLKKFNIPIISHAATAPSLSDKTLYPTFMRTVPPDGPLMDVIVEVLNKIKWKYVAVVYEDTAFGRASYNAMRSRLAAAGICLTTAVRHATDSKPADSLDEVIASGTTGAIFFGGQSLASSILDQAENHPGAGKLQWIFTDSLSFNQDFQTKTYQRGVLSIVATQRFIVEFEDHWVRIDENNPSVENPWFKAWYMEANQCRLQGVSEPSSRPSCNLKTEREKRADFIQNPFVEPAVHTVFTYANALKRAHLDKCGGGFVGMCQGLLDMTPKSFFEDYLQKVNFTYGKVERVPSLASDVYAPYFAAKHIMYDANGDIVNPAYDIWNYNNLRIGGQVGERFKKSGSYVAGRLDLNMDNIQMYSEDRKTPLASIPESPCPSTPCSPCLGAAPETKYLFIDGDIVITGVFSLHNQGQSPLTCGSYNGQARSPSQFLEGMIYALNQAQNLLPSIKIGGLAFDDCSSGVLASSILTQVQEGSLIIKDKNGNVLDPRKLDFYHASHTSALTYPIAELMDTFKRPLVSYGSFEEDLLNYEYYTRMSYGTGYEFKALVMMLKYLGFNYVQMVYQDHEYFTKGNKDFRRLAADEGICVVTEIMVEADAGKMVDMLRMRPGVKAVILNVGSGYAKLMLKGIAERNASGEFALFGIHTFGSNEQVVTDDKDAADGVISVAFQHSTLLQYQSYLKGLRVGVQSLINPWFDEWYQQIHQCYIKTSTSSGFTSPCNNTQNNDITNSTNFVLSYFTEHNIHAVYAIVRAIDATLTQICGSSTRVCGEYQSSKDKGKLLLENLKKVDFSPENADYNVRFNGKEVDQPFLFYNYDGTKFIQIGRYRSMMNQLDVTGNVRFYQGRPQAEFTPSCPGACVECLYMFQSQDYTYIDGDLIIPGMFDIHDSSTSTFSCSSQMTRGGFQQVEAFTFALNYIQSGQASVKLNNNLKLGGLAFDGCKNPRRALTIANAFQSNAIKFQDGNGNTIESRKTLAWLSYDSQTTIDLSNLMESLGLPVVSPGATTPILDDKNRFKTFFRTIPSDSVVVKAMADLTETLGFKYVMTINAPDSGSRTAKDAYVEYLKAKGICVLSSFEFVVDGTNELILSNMNQSTTRVVAVFAEPGMHVEEFLDTKATRFQQTDFIFISSRKLNVQGNSVRGRAVRDSISFDVVTPSIDQFRSYLSSRRRTDVLNKAWFREYFEQKYGCQLSKIFASPQLCNQPDRSVVDSNFIEDLYVLPTINALYALTEGLHLTLQEKCSDTYTTICSNFLTAPDTYARLMANMDALNFTDIRSAIFDFIERESNQGYEINRYFASGANTAVGTLKDKKISYIDEDNLQTLYKDVVSSCSGNCEVCSQTLNNFGDFTFIRGNVYLVGLFDVHKRGATPYTCGEINDKHGFQLLEAFNYAVEYVNNKTGIFKDKLEGVSLGAIGLDVCQNPTRAGNLVTNIHSGNINLRLKNGETIATRNIGLYVGPFDTDSTLRVADVLDGYSIPQISYGATSLELEEPKKYRYFLRTVPADDKQARAIVSYLKRFKVNFVQIISTFDSVGEKGKEEFKRLAPLNSICVEREIVVGYNGPVSVNEANMALNDLKNGTQSRVVILFMDDPRVILQAATRDPVIPDQFFFIGTDKWGMDEDMLIGLDRLVDNGRAVTFDVETADIPGFDKYLEDKTPGNYNRNPWFKTYYEREYGCTFETGTVKSGTACKDLRGISKSPKYVQDPYVLYVINAVFSAALGIDATIKDMCTSKFNEGVFYSGACVLFRNSGERRQNMYREIKKVNFTDDTYQPFYYLESGQSDRGYHIYEPKRTQLPSRYYYTNVGSYNDTDYLKIDIRYDMTFPSRCTNCPCKFPTFEPSRYMLKQSEFDLNVVYVGDIHKASADPSRACGSLSSISNFQRLLAFFYAINKVNNNPQLSASIRLGGLAMDTCSQPMRIGEDVFSLLSGEGLCGINDNVGGQLIAPSSIISFHAFSTANSLPLSRMLTPYQIVSLSPGATSVKLSDKRLHPYFLRTVPPDDIQALVMLQVMQEFNWDYASVVYTNNDYGITATNTLIQKAGLAGQRSCIGTAFAISSTSTDHHVDQIVEYLSTKAGARVVILFTEPAHSRMLLQAARRKGLTGRFVWLASDYWANSMEIVEGYEEEAVGAVTIQIRSDVVRSFTRYVTQLTLTNRNGIPDDWFEEFYQMIHRCRLLDTKVGGDYARVCNGDERITEGMITQDPSILHTIIAICQIAEGLQSIGECQGAKADVAACLSTKENKRQLIYNSVLNAQLNVLPEELDNELLFKFTQQGFGDIGYNILNFHRNVTQDRYVYSKIGVYQESLSLDRKLYRGMNILTSGVVPISTCPVSATCTCYGAGGMMGGGYIISGGGGAIVNASLVAETAPMSTYTYQHATFTTTYRLGSDGNYLDAKTGAILLVKGVQSGSDRFLDIWGIIIITFAAIGAFVAFVLFVYLLVVYPVRSGTTILGFLLLFGIILMYLLVFAFVFHASPVVCGLRRFALGFVYALVYAVLFVKLVDIWRCRKKDDMADIKYSKIGTPLGLFFLVFMLVLIQVIINAEWLILRIPGSTSIYYNSYIWPLCTPIGYYDAGLVMSLIYVMLLIVLCVIFGFATFSCSRNHYESRWILGIAILSIPTWVIWCLVSILAGYKFRDAAVAVGLLLCATYMLLCSSFRKFYLLSKYQALIEEEEQEEKEKRSHAGSTYGGSVTGRTYDNAPRFHGSLHGSHHGTMHSQYGYAISNKGRGKPRPVIAYGHPGSAYIQYGHQGASSGNTMLVRNEEPDRRMLIVDRNEQPGSAYSDVRPVIEGGDSIDGGGVSVSQAFGGGASREYHSTMIDSQWISESDMLISNRNFDPPEPTYAVVTKKDHDSHVARQQGKQLDDYKVETFVDGDVTATQQTTVMTAARTIQQQQQLQLQELELQRQQLILQQQQQEEQRLQQQQQMQEQQLRQQQQEQDRLRLQQQVQEQELQQQIHEQRKYEEDMFVQQQRLEEQRQQQELQRQLQEQQQRQLQKQLQEQQLQQQKQEELRQQAIQQELMLHQQELEEQRQQQAIQQHLLDKQKQQLDQQQHQLLQQEDRLNELNDNFEVVTYVKDEGMADTPIGGAGQLQVVNYVDGPQTTTVIPSSSGQAGYQVVSGGEQPGPVTFRQSTQYQVYEESTKLKEFIHVEDTGANQ